MRALCGLIFIVVALFACPVVHAEAATSTDGAAPKPSAQLKPAAREAGAIGDVATDGSTPIDRATAGANAALDEERSAPDESSAANAKPVAAGAAEAAVGAHAVGLEAARAQGSTASLPSASPSSASSERSPPGVPLDGGSASVAPSPAVVRVHERDVFTIRVPRAGQSAAERARAASQALETLLDDADVPPAHVEEHPPLMVVFVGATPIVTLGPEDAAAEGDIALSVHTASISTKVNEALRLERKRSAIAQTVFSFSLLVFSGLMAFLLFRRAGTLEDRLRTWMDRNPQSVPAFRFGRIEIVSPPAVRGAIDIAIRIGARLAQLTLAYAWLLIALSLFDTTRGYTERLTGFVVRPLTSLMGRAGSVLPVLVVGLIAALAVFLVLRFVSLFFGSVARGETKVGWLPSDLAGPTSVVVRVGIVVASLVGASPLITGSDEGALSRVGVAALITVALGCTPLLACGAVGVPIVFGRRLRPGDFVEVAGRSGRVRAVTLLELRLEDAWGCEVRVPHLIALWHSTRVVGRAPMVSILVTVDAAQPQGKVRDALMAGARAVSPRAKIELLSLDVDGARYRVACPDEPGAELAVAIADALAQNNITLGRSSITGKFGET